MNAFYVAYNLLLSGLGMVVLPPLWGYAGRGSRHKAAFAQRLGVVSDRHESLKGRPRIWIHAVSVGEVKVAEAIVQALDTGSRQCGILLTTTTATGQRYARQRFAHRAAVRYAPLDLWPAVGRFILGYRPDLLVCMETEIWPNWLVRANRMGIPTAFINGRISARSIRSYTAIKPLIRPVLETVSAFSMISDADARRIVAMGAPPQRVTVNGNAKMDSLLPDRQGDVVTMYRRLFSIGANTPVMVAGSVRGAEINMILDVYQDLSVRVPGLVFILAPRHVENTHRIKAQARARGIACQCRSTLSDNRPRETGLVILDTIGELRHVYAVATVVFCGASLVPLGGQNILEPAAWARPVLYGPSMEDFEAARTLLESTGGGICVANETELADRARHLLTHVDDARRIGKRALDAVGSCRGAARRHARVISRLLDDTAG